MKVKLTNKCQLWLVSTKDEEVLISCNNEPDKLFTKESENIFSLLYELQTDLGLINFDYLVKSFTYQEKFEDIDIFTMYLDLNDLEKLLLERKSNGKFMSHDEFIKLLCEKMPLGQPFEKYKELID
jgi:hypothetical protein